MRDEYDFSKGWHSSRLELMAKQVSCPHTHTQRCLYTDGQWWWVCQACGHTSPNKP